MICRYSDFPASWKISRISPIFQKGLKICHAKQRAGQLYRCRSLLSEQDVCTLYKSWIHPILEYGKIFYSGTVNTHLCRLDNLHSHIERTSSDTFQNLFFSVDMLLLWVWCVVCWLEKDEGTYPLTTHSYVELQFFAGLIGFIHMTQLNICTLLISATLRHLIDLNVVG